jgi:hypothetical protein
MTALARSPIPAPPTPPNPALALLQAELLALGQILPGLWSLPPHSAADEAAFDAEFEAEMDNLPL